MRPVAVTASCCGYEICSTGRSKSEMLDREIAHLKVGAQKTAWIGRLGDAVRNKMGTTQPLCT